jgi:RNA polymerase sigma-70 factor (ECF subfamily)
MPEQQATEVALSTDDSRLVAAVLQKDRKATAEFVEMHADAVYGYVRRRVAPRGDLVDDLVQEVFLAAWRSLAEFRGNATLRAWLLGIARHKVEDHYRTRLREHDSLEDETVAEPAELFAIDEELERAEIAERAEAVLAALPEPYGAALRWRYWEKRSAREMAAATGRTEKGIERLLARAREQFRKRWIDG